MNLGHCELFGHRSSAIFADVDYFPRFDGRYSLADFFSNQLVVSEAIPGNVHYHDSKLQQRKVVLMFKPVVDRQEHFTPSLQMLHQDVVGKASPSQIQDGGDSVVCFQEMFNARVYALIEHDPHRANGRRAIRPNALGPRREGRSPVGASHWGNRRERSRECHLPRRSQERSDRHTGAGKARSAVHHVRIHTDDFIEAQFLDDAHFPIRIRRTGSLLQALSSAPGDQGRSHGGAPVRAIGDFRLPTKRNWIEEV